MPTLTSLDDALPAAHPLRRIKDLARDALAPMQPLFVAMAPSWTVGPRPEQGLLAILLMALYGIRTEARFCEELVHNSSFRWFVNLAADEASFEAVPLAQTRSRLLRNSAASDFFERMSRTLSADGLLVDERFTPDLQQIAIWSGEPQHSAGSGGPT